MLRKRNINLTCFIFIRWILIISILFTFICLGCEELPNKPKSPYNPDDPNNPSNVSSLVLSPTKLSVQANSQFQVELWVTQVDSLAGVSAKIIFDPNKIKGDSIDFLEGVNNSDSESLLLKNGGMLIPFCKIENDSGFISLDCAVVEGNPKDVTGSGKVVRIVFTHKSDSPINLEISQTESMLRNSRNKTVHINNFIGSEVTVE